MGITGREERSISGNGTVVQRPKFVLEVIYAHTRLMGAVREAEVMGIDAGRWWMWR